MPRRKLTPGQSLVGAVSARTTNDTIRVLEHADRIGLWQPARPEIVRRPQQATVFMARNDTGANLVAGDVVSLDGLGVDSDNHYGEFKREITFSAGPVTASTGDRFGVATQPIANGTWGPVAVAGACVCRVDIDDVTHDYASSTSGATYLTSAASGGGAVILWQPGITGIVECVVRIDRGGSATVEPDTIMLATSHWETSGGDDVLYALDDAHSWFDSMTGDDAGIGVEVLCDSTSVFNDPIAEFTDGGFYLIDYSASAVVGVDGTLLTFDVTTGAASAGTAHTHDVTLNIPNAIWAGVYFLTRAGSVGAWAGSGIGNWTTTAWKSAWWDATVGRVYVRAFTKINASAGDQLGPVKWSVDATSDGLSHSPLTLDSPQAIMTIRRIGDYATVTNL